MLYNIKTKTSNILSRKKIITANSMQERTTLNSLTGIDQFFSHKNHLRKKFGNHSFKCR